MDIFEKRLKNFAKEGELTAFNLAMVAEALDTVEELKRKNIGGEIVEKRMAEEYKTWDPDIFKVDKDTENGFRRRLEAKNKPYVLLSEEVERLEINKDKPGELQYVVADPFDGSILFKKGIPDFWYSSLAFYDKNIKPLTSAVGDCIMKTLTFANEKGAFGSVLEGDNIVHKFKLDAAYREKMGRKNVTELKDASLESYALKPGKFLLPLIDNYREVVKNFKFFIPNGGPYGFVDVAEGKIDVYFATKQPFVDVFSGIYIAEQAGAVVTDFNGNKVNCVDNVHGMFDVLVSTNEELHKKVLEKIKK
ncbi:MAG: hypothetical protein A2297_00430 [Elusimicrobia bacterium RIFOXYB2_FULL_48_7]|nr:MAG: hypothetical protein A2297_00430 [Elusimicrobia bacterium RIFOXYB2_FULL_48_7]